MVPQVVRDRPLRARRPVPAPERVAVMWLAVVLLVGSASATARGAKKSRPPKLSARAVRVQLLDPPATEGGDPVAAPAAAAVPALPEPWLVHGDTGQRAIASVSKLFALMVVLDRGLDMDGTTEIVASDKKWTRGGARSRLRVGYRYRNRDLVTAALMSSDNRAPLALGRAVGLSRKALARAMVEKARSIGLRRVGFEEPVGLSYDNQASAEGLVLALRAALAYPAIAEATSEPNTVITPAGRKRPRERYVNTNRLVRWGYDGILGGKTGYNSKAGHCLVFAVRLPDGRRVAIVILGAPTRNALFRDAKRVYKWTVREAKRR